MRVQANKITLMCSLFLLSFFQSVFASHQTTQLPKEYFQTCIEDDKSMVPKFNLGNYAYMVAFLCLMNGGARIYRTLFLRKKLKQRRMPYCYYVVGLYWEVAMGAIFAILMYHQSKLFHRVAKVQIVLSISVLVFSLYQIDKCLVSNLEKMGCLLFQLLVIVSFSYEPYLPFRIIFTTFAFLPVIQTIYGIYNKKADKCLHFSFYQGLSIIFYCQLVVAFPIATMDPQFWYHFDIQVKWGSFLNIIFAILSIIDLNQLVKKARLILRKWNDQINGRLLANQPCAICLGDKDAYGVVEKVFSGFQILKVTDQYLIRTQCGHTFHSACMKEWIRAVKLFCPMDYRRIPLQSQ